MKFKDTDPTFVNKLISSFLSAEGSSQFYCLKHQFYIKAFIHKSKKLSLPWVDFFIYPCFKEDTYSMIIIIFFILFIQKHRLFFQNFNYSFRIQYSKSRSWSRGIRATVYALFSPLRPNFWGWHSQVLIILIIIYWLDKMICTLRFLCWA